MTFAIASLTHSPISPTALESNPARAANASTARRTPARAAGSLGTSSSSPGDRPGASAGVVDTLDPVSSTGWDGTGDDIGEHLKIFNHRSRSAARPTRSAELKARHRPA